MSSATQTESNQIVQPNETGEHGKKNEFMPVKKTQTEDEHTDTHQESSNETIKKLKADGFVVLKGFLKRETAKEVYDDLTDVATAINENHSWSNPKGKHGWSNNTPTPWYHGIAHAQSLWDIRESECVHRVFSEFYDKKDMLVSMEPPSIFTNKIQNVPTMIDHLKIHPNGGKLKVEPFVALRMSILVYSEKNTSSSESGTSGRSNAFHFCKSAHLTVEDHIKNAYTDASESKPLVFTEKASKEYFDTHKSEQIEMEVGDAILYYASCPRAVEMPTGVDVYIDVSMQPSAWASKFDIEKRIDAFKNARATGCVCVVKPLFTRLAKDIEQTYHICPPRLTKRGWYLIHRSLDEIEMYAAAALVKKRKRVSSETSEKEKEKEKKKKIEKNEKQHSERNEKMPISKANKTNATRTDDSDSEERPAKKVAESSDSRAPIAVEIEIRIGGQRSQHMTVYV